MGIGRLGKTRRVVSSMRALGRGLSVYTVWDSTSGVSAAAAASVSVFHAVY